MDVLNEAGKAFLNGNIVQLTFTIMLLNAWLLRKVFGK
jgi:hypothetical protein